MLVVVAGGRGRVARRLTRRLQLRGDRVRGIIRRPDQGQDVRAAGGTPVVRDLETATVQEVADAIRGAEAVVFAAGAGPGSGPDRKWTMDHGGAVKLIAAAKLESIDRYVMLSSKGADPAVEG